MWMIYDQFGSSGNEPFKPRAKNDATIKAANAPVAPKLKSHVTAAVQATMTVITTKSRSMSFDLVIRVL